MQLNAPSICSGCKYLERQSEEDMGYMHPGYDYCRASLWFPKKDSCKRKRKLEPKKVIWRLESQR